MSTACFLISYVFYKQIMASGNVPPQRSEGVVRGDGNCFYRAIALWRDEMSDEKHEEIRRLSSTLIERNPKVFQPFLFASNSVKEHVEKSKITGTCCNLELITINSSSPRQNIFLIFRRVKPSYSNVRKNLLLFWVPPIVVTTPHSAMIATGHNSNIIYVTELQNIPQGACTQLKWLYWVISSHFIPNLVIS